MKNTDKLFELAGVDACLVVSEKNRFYFTGFASTFGYLLLFPQNESVFITDPRYYEMAQSLVSDGVEVVQIANGTSANQTVAEIFARRGVSTVGFEDTELTVREYLDFEKDLHEYKLMPVGQHINTVRSVKSEEELAFIAKAQSITDAAFSDIIKVIKPGMTEIEVRIELEYAMAKHGAEGLAFDTIIASGINGSKPHAHPTEKKISNGEAVTMDFGARYHGYCSDMTRTVFVGEPSDEMRNIYNVVLMAQKAGIANAYCGMTGREYDAFCREVIKANGFEQYFTHSTGHSLGIDIHEYPYGSMRTDNIIGNNQLITCEPGIYVPGVGGVRIEDLLVVKENGVVDLTTSEKNIIIL